MHILTLSNYIRDLEGFSNSFCMMTLRRHVFQAVTLRLYPTLESASLTNSSPGKMSDASLFQSLCASLAVPHLPCWFWKIIRRRMMCSLASTFSLVCLRDGMPITVSLTADMCVGNSASLPASDKCVPRKTRAFRNSFYRSVQTKTSLSGEDTLIVKMNYRSRSLALLVNQKSICGSLKVVATH